MKQNVVRSSYGKGADARVAEWFTRPDRMGEWWNGIHAGLKILWSQDRVGSSPTSPILSG